MLVQYIIEDDGHRAMIHFKLVVDGDTSGTFYELFREEGEPDSGSFTYHLNEDRTFVIPNSEIVMNGIIDDQGHVFSIVGADSGFALFAVGVRKSSGKTVADLSGEYWVSEFFAADSFQAVGFDYVDFDGAGNATLYRIENTVGELDTIEFEYTVDDEGTINMDDFLDGIMSPDGQFLVAAASGGGEEIGDNVFVIGIRKSAGLDNSVLSGSYIYNQVRTESGDPDEESSFYARVNFDGEGTGEVTMFLGEAYSDTFFYDIESDGSFELDSTLGAIFMDGRYFFNIELGDSESVAFGLGIRGEDFSLSVERDLYGVTPNSFVLSQNYPNPFNPLTTISYQLAAGTEIELSVYDILGRKVATLLSGKQPAGVYTVEWDASSMATGIYYYMLRTKEGLQLTKRMVLVK